MDIDIGSAHGEDFPVNLAHVQGYKIVKGKPKREKRARLLTDKEIKKWGDLLKLANPNVRFE